MSFIIGVTIGYACSILIQNESLLRETKDFYNQNIYNNKINNIHNFIDFEISNLDKNANNEWKVRIPKIGLEAIIESGTTKEILDEFVGHFEETNRRYGNIGLAAHNRGYKVNYFEKIKYLEIGDEIYYSYCGTEKIYVVESKNIIEDTNWKVLENTKDNRITLITCVENRPKYRLCVQGIEKYK